MDQKIRQLIFLVIGVALCEAVVFHSYVTSFLYAASPAGYMGEPAISIFGIGFFAAASGALMVAVRIKPFSFSPTIPAAILSLGYVVGFFHNSIPLPPEALFILLGLAYGVGGLLFRAKWLETLSAIDVRTASLVYVVALLLGLAFSFLILHLEIMLAFPLLIASALLSSVLARRCKQKGASARLKNTTQNGRLLFAKVSKSLLGPIIGVSVLEGIIGVLNISMFSSGDLTLFSENSVWVIRLVLLVSFAAALTAIPQRFNTISLFKASFPFTVGGLLLLALLGSSQGALTSNILLIGYNLVYIACMLLLIETVCEGRAHPYMALGLFGFVTSLFLLGGFILGFLLDQIKDTAGFTSLTLIGFSCVYLLSMALLFFSFGGKHLQASRKENYQADFSRKYSLSPRETDVLQYLVRGRSAAHIATTLGLSENTIGGYTKSIYGKTGVHSKQDLIGLFDEFCKLPKSQ